MNEYLENFQPFESDEFFLNLRTGAWYDLIHWKKLKNTNFNSKLNVSNKNNASIENSLINESNIETIDNNLFAFRPNYCYFQSKNGHSETMSFASLRFNPHILFSCSIHNRCFIVDATRRGKIYPDSLLKTIPIWISIINKQVLGWQDDKLMTHLKYVGKSELNRAQTVVEKYHIPEIVVNKMQEKLLQLRKENNCSWYAPFLGTEQNLNQQSLVLKPIFINPNSPYKQWESNKDYVPIFLISASESERESKLQGTYTYLPGAGDDMEAWIPSKNYNAEIFWRSFNILELNEDDLEEDIQSNCIQAQDSIQTAFIYPIKIHSDHIFIADQMNEEYINKFDTIILLGSPKALKSMKQFSNVYSFPICNHKKFKRSLEFEFPNILKLVIKLSQENVKKFDQINLDEVKKNTQFPKILILNIDSTFSGIETAFAVAILMIFYLYEAPDFILPKQSTLTNEKLKILKSLTMLCQIDFPNCFLSKLLYKQMKQVVEKFNLP